jgi:hypothetical protein
LLLIKPNYIYHGFFIELKRPKTLTNKAGVVSKQQKEFIKRARADGYKAEVYFDWEEAKADIINYLKLGKR